MPEMSNFSLKGNGVTKVDVAFANNATVSDAVDLGNRKLLSLQFPADFDGTSITFQVSHDGTNYGVLDAGTGSALTYTIAASGTIRSLSLPTTQFSGWRYFKVVSGTSQSPATTVTAGVENIS